MLGVLAANHHYDAIAADHLAVFAARFNRRSYLHALNALPTTPRRPPMRTKDNQDINAVTDRGEERLPFATS